MRSHILAKVFFSKKRTAGFSLTELLVVVGIIVVLAAVLLAVSAKFVEAGKSAKCMSNLRQLGGAVGSFVAENQNYPSAFTVGMNMGWDGPYWMDQLQTYLPNATADRPGFPPGWYNRNDVFYCPAEKTHHPYSDYGPNSHVIYIGRNMAPVRPHNVTRPSKVLLFMDSRWGTGKEGSFLIDTGAFLSDPKRAGLTGSPYPPRHGGGKIVNTIFCDGHVEAISFDDLSTNRNELFGANGL